jgi:hypothetical protein
LLVAVGVAMPVGAQLLDPVSPPAADEEAQAEAPREQPEPAPEPAERAEDAPKRATAKRTEPSEPPPSIARPRLRDRIVTPGTSGEEPTPRRPLLILFLSLLGVVLVLFAAERARGWITTNIALTRVLGGIALFLRVAAIGLLLAIVLQLIPEGQDWILWGLVVLVLVVGWSVRDLFADLVAGGVLAMERRVKKGVWVSGDGFQGTVEGRTLRATWLRDGQGHRLTVPNRAMVGAPMVYDAGADAEHEVVVRLEGYEDASKVRMALTDAILSSPWVLAGANPIVLRDPADPVVWRVRTKLLEPRFSVHFEGELLERVEDLLRYEPPAEERETVPSDLPQED